MEIKNVDAVVVVEDCGWGLRDARQKNYITICLLSNSKRVDIIMAY